MNFIIEAEKTRLVLPDSGRTVEILQFGARYSEALQNGLFVPNGLRLFDRDHFAPNVLNVRRLVELVRNATDAFPSTPFSRIVVRQCAALISNYANDELAGLVGSLRLEELFMGNRINPAPVLDDYIERLLARGLAVSAERQPNNPYRLRFALGASVCYWTHGLNHLALEVLEQAVRAFYDSVDAVSMALPRAVKLIQLCQEMIVQIQHEDGM